MKKLSIFCVFIVITIQLTSCKSYNEEEIKDVANTFLDAMHKPVDFKTMTAHYKDFDFVSVPRADKHTINSIKEINNEILANVSTSFTNHRGKIFKNNFILKFEKIDDTWKIVNSYNLSNPKGMYPKVYKYALEKNLLKKTDSLWDVDLLKTIKKAKKVFEKLNLKNN